MADNAADEVKSEYKVQKTETHYSMDDGTKWVGIVTQNVQTALIVLGTKKVDSTAKQLASMLLEKSLRELNSIKAIPNV